MLPLLALAAITAVLDPSPAITGNCNPTRVHFTGHITAEGPVKVTYTWVRLNHPANRAVTVDFSKAGTVPVSYDLLIHKSEEGSVMLRLVLPEQGDSAKVKYQVKCR